MVDPETGTDAVRDLAVLDGRLAAADAAGESVPRLDASGLIAAPAFCDLHTHLRQPGGEASETIESGTRAAPTAATPRSAPCRTRSLPSTSRRAWPG